MTRHKESTLSRWGFELNFPADFRLLEDDDYLIWLLAVGTRKEIRLARCGDRAVEIICIGGLKTLISADGHTLTFIDLDSGGDELK